MEPRISIVTIAVNDLDRAAAFYEAMGLTRHRIRDGVAFFQMGGMIFGLFPRKDAEPDAGVTFSVRPRRYTSPTTPARKPRWTTCWRRR